MCVCEFVLDLLRKWVEFRATCFFLCFFLFFSTVITDSCSHKSLLYLPFLFVPLYVGRDVDYTILLLSGFCCCCCFCCFC